MEAIGYTVQFTVTGFSSAVNCASPLTVPNCYKYICTGESSAHVLFHDPFGLTYLPGVLRAYAPQIRGTG